VAWASCPNLSNEQTISATVVVSRSNSATPSNSATSCCVPRQDGSTVRLKDVARIEVGAQTYSAYARLNGKPALGMAVQLSPTGNALATATAAKARLEELRKYFPSGVDYSVPYDTSASSSCPSPRSCRPWWRPWSWCSW
jgi:multidrug efflux pump